MNPSAPLAMIQLPAMPLTTNEQAVEFWSALSDFLYALAEQVDDVLPATVPGKDENVIEHDSDEDEDEKGPFRPFSRDSSENLGNALDQFLQSADSALGSYTRQLRREKTTNLPVHVPAGNYPQQPGYPQPGGYGQPGYGQPNGYPQQPGYGQPPAYSQANGGDFAPPGAWQQQG